MAEILDVDEAEEAEPFIARCTRHRMADGCEASLPDCEREFMRLPDPGTATWSEGGEWP